MRIAYGDPYPSQHFVVNRLGIFGRGYGWCSRLFIGLYAVFCGNRGPAIDPSDSKQDQATANN